MNKWEKEVQQSLLNSEEAAIKALDKSYKAALRDINDKIRLFDADIKMLDTALEQATEDEKARLLSMRQSKIYQQQYQEALKKQVSAILDKLHSDNYATLEAYLKRCYDDAYIGAMYSMAQQGIPVILPIDQTQVVQAVLTDSKISKGLYTALGVDTAKLKKSITQEISRGIATGLSYGMIAQNISNATNAPKSRTNTILRTEGHRIQAKAIYDICVKAKERGADIVRRWSAVFDGKTRPHHRQLDGQVRGVDEPFEIGGMKVMRPGEFGRASEDCNCRCTAWPKPRWAIEGSITKMDNFTKEIRSFETPADYEKFKERYWSKENIEYMKYVNTLEKRYGTKDFNSLLGQMTDREYQHFHKLEAASPMWKTPNGKAGKMATANSGNDWSKSTPRNVTKQERADITKYAKEKGVGIGDIRGFDGDPEMLKVEIDELSKLQTAFPAGKRIVVNVSSKMDDDDFAETIQTTITFNTKALRDKVVTAQNIINGGEFASKTFVDIAHHEYGHVYTQLMGNKGIEIAGKAYYNVFGESVSDEDLITFLYEHISPYAVDVTGKNRLKEIIPEILAKNNSSSSAFTVEFIRLLKEG